MDGPRVERRGPRAWRGHPSLERTALWSLVVVLMGAIALVLTMPATGDAAFFTSSVWAIAHGHLSCAYPPKVGPAFAVPMTYIAPLYPLLGGLLAGIARVGSSVTFPSAAAMGPHCTGALVAIYRWSQATHAAVTTARLGLVTLVPLVLAVVAHPVAAAPRARRVEMGSALLVLTSLPILSAFSQYAHPQDVLAAALAWLGVAAAIRQRWTAAGVALGLAVASNQVALLAAIVVVLAIEVGGRRRLVAAAAAAVGVVYLPLLVAGGPHSWAAILAGSGFNNSLGGTVVWEMGLPTLLKYAVSRGAALVAAVALVWWFRRRHPGPIEPATMVALVTIGFSLRLVFEANLWGYYYIPVVLGLIILDRRRGRIRAGTIAWSLVQLALYDWLWIGSDRPSFLLESWPLYLGQMVAAAVVAFGALRALRQRRDRAAWLTALIIYGLAFVASPHLWHTRVMFWPVWLVQLILVPWAIGLAWSGRDPSSRVPADGPSTVRRLVGHLAQWDPGSDRGTLGG